jgi:TM2 domain-containing membrane protein YozV
MNVPRSPLVAALWSVAIPGFGQLYNRKYVKAVIFIILEFFINLYSHLNLAIYYSWLFDIPHAQAVINYEWLLFYPCMYVFAIFDAYHDCCDTIGRAYSRYVFIPFVGTSFIGTVGIIWSSGKIHVPVLEKIGPVFVGVFLLTLGMGLGAWATNRFFPRT